MKERDHSLELEHPFIEETSRTGLLMNKIFREFSQGAGGVKDDEEEDFLVKTTVKTVRMNPLISEVILQMYLDLNQERRKADQDKLDAEKFKADMQRQKIQVFKQQEEINELLTQIRNLKSNIFNVIYYRETKGEALEHLSLIPLCED